MLVRRVLETVYRDVTKTDLLHLLTLQGYTLRMWFQLPRTRRLSALKYPSPEKGGGYDINKWLAVQPT